MVCPYGCFHGPSFMAKSKRGKAWVTGELSGYGTTTYGMLFFIVLDLTTSFTSFSASRLLDQIDHPAIEPHSVPSLVILYSQRQDPLCGIVTDSDYQMLDAQGGFIACPYATRCSEPLHHPTKTPDHRTCQSIRSLLIVLSISLHAPPRTPTTRTLWRPFLLSCIPPRST